LHIGISGLKLFTTVFIIYFFSVGAGGLSNKMRCGGENSSSNWPLRTLQIKAARKTAATDILAINKMTMAFIKTVIFYNTKVFVSGSMSNDMSQREK
jgi:hypothetical protein